MPHVVPAGYVFTPGKACVLGETARVAIVACGVMVEASLHAALLLKQRGINCQVVNMSSIKPLDTATLASVAEKSVLIVTVEEHLVAGGLGSACAESLAASKSRPPLIMVGVEDRFGQSGEPQELLAAYELTAQHIAARIERALVR